MKIRNPTKIHLVIGSKYYIIGGMFYKYTVWEFYEQVGEILHFISGDINGQYTKAQVPQELYTITNRWIIPIKMCYNCNYESIKPNISKEIII